MKTHSVKASEIEKSWYIVDAANQSVGRIASQIAYVLLGKHKPNFVSYLDSGDYVVVTNAAKSRFSGNKLKQKFYYRYSNYIGGLKKTRADDAMQSNPERVIMAAVRGMLPGNKQGRKILKNLRVYSGAEHGQSAQMPKAMPQRLIGKGN